MDSRLKAQVIAEWRGMYEPRPRPDRLTTAADVVVRLMKSFGLTERLRQEEITAAWREIVGDFIAAHSEPARLQSGVLYIRVLQPTMHYELDRVWKARILKNLRARFGAKTVREIRFNIG